MIRLMLTSSSRQATKQDLIDILLALDPTLRYGEFKLEDCSVNALRVAMITHFNRNVERMRTLAAAVERHQPPLTLAEQHGFERAVIDLKTNHAPREEPEGIGIDGPEVGQGIDAPWRDGRTHTFIVHNEESLDPRARYTLLEYMPIQHRESHSKCRNQGTWPANGAERVYVNGEVTSSQLDPTWATVIEDNLRELPEGETALAEVPREALPPAGGDDE